MKSYKELAAININTQFGNVGDVFTLPGEHLSDDSDDQRVTVALNLREQGMCVVRLENGDLLEVCYDCLFK